MLADNEDAEGAGAPQGLSWSYEMDFGALIAAITGADPPDPDAPSADPRSVGPPAADPADEESVPAAPASSPAPGSAEEEAAQEAVLDDLAELDARAAAEGRVDGGRVPLSAVAGRVAERLAPGPDLAAWLAAAPPAGLGDGDLAAVAGSWRRVASWAQARELAAVAQITARAAARDEKADTGPDGRPSQVTRIRCRRGSAGADDVAVRRVGVGGPGRAAGLAAGRHRRRAGRRDHRPGPRPPHRRGRQPAQRRDSAGGRGPGAARGRGPDDRDAPRGAAPCGDRRGPGGAEERRKDAERRSQVVLYPDQDCTATLAGQRLPAVHAAAAMARVKAMARALKASGAGGSIDLLSAQIYLGLLLGTLPIIPPRRDPPARRTPRPVRRRRTRPASRRRTQRRSRRRPAWRSR